MAAAFDGFVALERRQIFSKHFEDLRADLETNGLNYPELKRSDNFAT